MTLEDRLSPKSSLGNEWELFAATRLFGKRQHVLQVGSMQHIEQVLARLQTHNLAANKNNNPRVS
jgi:hypothetical protein